MVCKNKEISSSVVCVCCLFFESCNLQIEKFLIVALISFSCQNALVGTSSTMLNGRGKSGCLCLLLGLAGKTFPVDNSCYL